VSEKLDKIKNSIKSAGHSWWAAESRVSKLSDDQKKRRLGGKKPKKIPKLPKRLNSVRVPTSLDYRIGGFVSAVKDQGDCGSCWAFGTTAALESMRMIADNTPDINLDLAEQMMVRCDVNDFGCDGGYPDAAADFVVESGLPLESCYPYTATDGSCGPCAKWQDQAVKASEWIWVTDDVPDAQLIKEALVTYGPLTTCMDVYDDFFYYSGGVYKYSSGGLAGGHLVCIIGYNDPLECFIVKNSWGDDWGESGFFRIGYSELKSKVLFGQYSIALSGGSTPPPPPPPPPPPSNTHTILASAGTGGSISPSGTITVDDGADQSFSITPDVGYVVSDVIVDGVSVGATSTYSFTKITKDHTIAALFEVAPTPPNGAALALVKLVNLAVKLICPKSKPEIIVKGGKR
jgi:C1A family cysteine protease